MEDKNHSEKRRKEFFSQAKMNKNYRSLEELNTLIAEITTEINENYPELIKYLDETPLTLSNQDDPDVTLDNLQSYYESLVSILEKYKSERPE
jgi:hypothetical protein